MWEIDLRDTRMQFEEHYERLFEKLRELALSRPLPAVALTRIKENLSLEWTYNSNSIEGNTLSLRETRMILQDGITIKGKSLREHFEAHNHDRAIDLLYSLVNQDTRLRSIDFLSLHSLVLRSIEDDYAGRIRNGGVRISGANFTPPAAAKVSGLLDQLVDFINTNPLGLNIIELATVFHHKFVWIHPFFDGNGRTVRLAMNLILMRAGFPPAIILRNDRQKYYDALNRANTGKYDKLLLLMTQALERSLNIYLSAVSDEDRGYKEISGLLEDIKVPYGQEYISLLARQGKIDAYKEGKNWYTSEKAIRDYMAGRKRKRAL